MRFLGWFCIIIAALLWVLPWIMFGSPDDMEDWGSLILITVLCAAFGWIGAVIVHDDWRERR